METIKRQCNVVILPNDKEDRTLNQIYKFIARPENSFDKRVFGELIRTASPNKSKYQCQYLYFLSDEEINEEDWCIIDLGDFSRAVRVKSLNNGHPIFAVDITEGYAKISDLKKIIASTDTSLGLPQPSTAFIDKYITEYNKGNIIEMVMVEYFKIHVGWEPDYSFEDEGIEGSKETYQFIPKISKDNTITISKVKDSWNRKEIEKLLDNCWEAAVDYTDKVIKMNYGLSNDEPTLTDKDSWINKNL